MYKCLKEECSLDEYYLDDDEREKWYDSMHIAWLASGKMTLGEMRNDKSKFFAKITHDDRSMERWM